jgi:transcriptional antiterminator
VSEKQKLKQNKAKKQQKLHKKLVAKPNHGNLIPGSLQQRELAPKKLFSDLSPQA